MTVERLAREAPGRKRIHAAGILIVQPDAETAQYWQDALADYGMGGVQIVASTELAAEMLEQEIPAGIVVAVPDPDEAYQFMARIAAREYGDLADTPVVVALAQPTRSAVIAAAKAGFSAVLPFPLQPRLIYRRMGSLMQKARRLVRQRDEV